MSLSLRTSPALVAADSNIRLRARRGLIIYFAVLIPLSVVFETLAIRGSSWWISALMWTPAAASVVARLALHDGFGDVSFRLGGRRGSKAIGLALIFPVVIGLIAYGIAWSRLCGWRRAVSGPRSRYTQPGTRLSKPRLIRPGTALSQSCGLASRES